MSMQADFCDVLEEMIKKYPNSLDAVIDTFYGTVSNLGWSTEDNIYILESGKGISSEADKILDKFIELENRYK